MANKKHIRPTPNLTGKDIDRFWSKVRKSDEPNECWEWIGNKADNGYGVFSVKHGGYVAHRIAYFIETGNDPGQLLVLHRCDVRACCRFSHLFLGTHSDNMADMKTKGRAATGDRNAARLYPETRARGLDHWCHKDPEKFSITFKKLAKGRGKWKGEDQWHHKLTESDVMEIRKLWPTKTLKELTKIYGVSESCISAVTNRRSWKHIPQPVSDHDPVII